MIMSIASAPLRLVREIEVNPLPSTTFYNLPEEKRQKLLDAAWDEFSRVAFGDASINKIIQAAEIPRGSFYMYFSNKEDLFHHLMTTTFEQAATFLGQLLTAQRGDLFASFVALFDYVVSDYHLPEHFPIYDRLLRVIRLNGELRPNLFFGGDVHPSLPRSLTDQVDTRHLNLSEDSDLTDFFHLLGGVTIPCLCQALAAPDAAAVRIRYLHLLHILRRGLEAPHKGD